MCILAPRNMTRKYFPFGLVAETGHGGVSEHLRYTILLSKTRDISKGNLVLP
jgi:hypothetical protein